MAQNLYDDEAFFSHFSNLARSKGGLDGTPEWATLRAMLPDLAGTRVVDLGCGSGLFCRWAHEAGAREVLGLDISDKMLAAARASTSMAGISYLKSDLDDIQLPKSSFELAFSAVVLQYVTNLETLFATVYEALVPGGHLIFSAEHPIFTAPSKPRWIKNEGGRSVWQLDSYLDEGARVTFWKEMRIIKQHRTVATYVNLLLHAGFSIVKLEEWGPSVEQIAKFQQRVNNRDRPNALLIAARR
jgi:ubiquinone/menaquinone biosynthesis C-methylase UbiE